MDHSIEKLTKLSQKEKNILKSNHSHMFITILLEKSNLSLETSTFDYENSNFHFPKELFLVNKEKIIWKFKEISSFSVNKPSFSKEKQSIPIKSNTIFHFLSNILQIRYKNMNMLSIFYILHLINMKIKYFYNVTLLNKHKMKEIVNQYALNCNSYIEEVTNTKLKLKKTISFNGNKQTSLLTLSPNDKKNEKEKEKEKEIQIEKEKEKENHTSLHQIFKTNENNKMRKLIESKIKQDNNIKIYVAEYETLVNKQNEPCIRQKIYEGNLFTSEYLIYKPDLNKNYRDKNEMVNVNKLINESNKKYIFIPNNVKLDKQKLILEQRAKKDGIVYENLRKENILSHVGKEHFQKSFIFTNRPTPKEKQGKVFSSSCKPEDRLLQLGIRTREDIKKSLNQKKKVKKLKRRIFQSLTEYNKYFIDKEKYDKEEELRVGLSLKTNNNKMNTISSINQYNSVVSSNNILNNTDRPRNYENNMNYKEKRLKMNINNHSKLGFNLNIHLKDRLKCASMDFINK